MEISVENLQKKVALNPPQILRTAKAILRHEGVEKASLAIVFVTAQRIAAFNRKYLHRNYATDVLAFDAGGLRKRKVKTVAGDIIISTDSALKNSRKYRTGVAQEIVLYMAHGILHLLGYDDHKTDDRRKMRKKERELLARLKAGARKIVL